MLELLKAGMLELLKASLGVIAGLLWAVVGYAVARSKGEDFEPKNFGSTLAVGFILGLLSMVTEIDIATLDGYTAVQLATILADKLLGLIQKPPSKEV